MVAAEWIARDADCVAFLQWAAPRVGLRWPGFRKVRGQVCKRVARRGRELGLGGLPLDRESSRRRVRRGPWSTRAAPPRTMRAMTRAVFGDALGERMRGLATVLPQRAA